jgi:hypothetical protein
MFSAAADFPVGVSEEASEHLDIEITLALEVAIKSAVRQAGTCHDLLERGIVKAVAIEKPARAIDHFLLLIAPYISLFTARRGPPERPH